MICPYCNNEDTNVLESRGISGCDGVRRRRQCKKCQKRFTTHEKVVNIDLRVIKKSGRVEQYEREKLVKGVMKACYKRRIQKDVVDSLVDEVEVKLLNRKTTEIRSRDIGKMVLSRLIKVDGLAYLRFASVYLEFDSAEEFKRFVLKAEINNLHEEDES